MYGQEYSNQIILEILYNHNTMALMVVARDKHTNKIYTYIGGVTGIGEEYDVKRVMDLGLKIEEHTIKSIYSELFN